MGRRRRKGFSSTGLIPAVAVLCLIMMPSKLGSFRASLWVWAQLPLLLLLSLVLWLSCSRGQQPAVHQQGLVGGAEPAGRCHGRQDLRGLTAAPQEEVSPPAQEVQEPPLTESGLLELAAKRLRLRGN